jgi:hypothetical protein
MLKNINMRREILSLGPSKGEVGHMPGAHASLSKLLQSPSSISCSRPFEKCVDSHIRLVTRKFSKLYRHKTVVIKCSKGVCENGRVERSLNVSCRPCHSSCGYSSASHCGTSHLILGGFMWESWWMKCHWIRVFCGSVRFGPLLHTSLSMPPCYVR